MLLPSGCRESTPLGVIMLVLVIATTDRFLLTHGFPWNGDIGDDNQGIYL